MRALVRILLIILISACLTSGAYLGGYGTAAILRPTPQSAVSLEAQEQFRVFWEAWRVVQEEFYDGPVEASELTYGATRGAVAALGDPFSWFADPEEAERIREAASGRYSGIGAVVNENEAGNVIIVRPFRGGPADLGGLLPGDVVLQVEGTGTRDLTLEQSVALIRGPAGTPVHLVVQRTGLDEPFEAEIVRADIDVPSVEYRVLDEGVAYLKLNDFRGHAAEQLHAALGELLAEEPPALILDLRDNPGGLFSASIEIGSEFIEEGVIALEKGSNDLDKTYMALGDGLATEIPLAVLINEGSASASEIVAGAIRDQGRGILIGETTLGKGAVQNPVDLSDGSHLRLTIAYWFPPDGQLIQGEGIAPDIEVPLTEEDLAAGRDPQLEQAVANLLGR